MTIPQICGCLLDYLKKSGFDVLVAPNGERALRQLERIQPDLILLDVLMPGIDGFETCLELKQNEKTRDIPVIFMTALADMADKIRGFEVGGVDYLTKPLQLQEVLLRIETHLKIQKLQQQLKGAKPPVGTAKYPISARSRRTEANGGRTKTYNAAN